jgi:myo-inositol-1(or 4)-monophosphatase
VGEKYEENRDVKKMNNSETLKVALKAAVEAGNTLIEHNKDNLKVSKKESLRDIVTEIDKIAEREIINVLKDFNSEITILTEESGISKGKKDNLTWVVDALDGTVNYVNNLQYYGVSIALLENNTPIVGVIFNPITEELYYGAEGIGVFKNQKQISVLNKPFEEGLFTVAFSGKNHDPVNRTEEFLKFGEVNDSSRGCLRTGSAAMNLAYLAEGKFSGCWGKANKNWDISAGILLAKLAGAKMIVSEKNEESNLVSYLAAVPNSWEILYQKIGKTLGL